MLSLPAHVQTLLASGAPLATVLGVRVHWPSDPRTYLDADVLLDGAPLPARLVALDDVAIAADAADPVAPATLPVASGVARLHDASLAPDDARPSERLAAAVWRRLRVEVLVAWTPATAPAPRSLATDDLVPLATLAPVAFHLDGPDVVLSLRDPWRALGERDVAPRWIAADPARHPFPHRDGERLPFIFGRARGVRLAPWRFGAVADLAADLHPGAATATLASLDGFPDAGAVQVGNEVMTYEAVGRLARQLGTPGRPLDRPEARFHPAGERVWFVPPDGFAWTVAAHPCADVRAPRHRDEPLADGTWSIASHADPGAGGLDGGPAHHALLVMPRLATRLVAPAAVARLRMDDTFGVAWSPTSFNTAINPAGALTHDDSADAARLSLLMPRLDLAATPIDLGAAGFGTIRRATFVVRLAAAPAWRADSALWIGATDGVASIVRQVVPPAGSVVDGVPYHIPHRTWRLDVTSEAAALWELLRGGHRLFAQFAAHPADAAIIQVTSLAEELEVERPELRRAIVALRADVDGWMADAGAVIESPAPLVAAIARHAAGFAIGDGAIAPSDVAAIADGDASRGVRVRRVVRAGATWRTLLEDLLDASGLALLPEGATWRLVRRVWPDDLVVPGDAVPLDDLFASPRDQHEPRASSSLGRAVPPLPPRRWVVAYGREDDDAGWPRVALARHGDAPGGDGAEAAPWLPADQPDAATALAVRRLDAMGAAPTTTRLAGPWTFLRNAWVGDEGRLAAALPEAPPDGTGARFGRIAAVAILADRTGLAIDLRDRSHGTVAWSGGPARVLVHPARGIAFVVAGRVVAFLRRDGWLHLRERILEPATLAAPPTPLPSPPVWWDDADERLLLGAPWMGDVLPVAAFTAAGALLLPGTLRTGATDLPAQLVPLAEGDATLTFGGVHGRALLRLFAPSRLFLLRGEVVERAVVG